MSHTVPSRTGPALLDAVERERVVRRWHLGFAPEVEARYEADQGDTRRRELIIAGLVALVVYNLFLLNDRLVRPEVFDIAVGWRLGFLTVYGGAVLLMIHHGLRPFWREAAMASTMVASVIASGAIFHATRSPFGIFDPFVFSLIFLACNIGFPLRFAPALVATMVGVLVDTAFIVSAPAMPREAGSFAIAMTIGGAVFTLLAAWRTEMLARRSYLLLLRETLRAEAANETAEAFAALSNTDALTQLPNRRCFESRLADAWTLCRATGVPLALLMIDIDHFKRFNDAFGHPAGDDCLRRVGAALQETLRDGDFVARLGGEEFVVLLPGSGAARAAAVAERLRRAVENLSIAHDGQDGRTVVTASLGIALAAPGSAMSEDLLRAADAALYDAKRAGRNRFMLSETGGLPETADADELI